MIIYMDISNMTVQLTEKQKKFYTALRQMVEKSGHSPTVAELARRMKFSSPRAVTQYLEALERKGLIERRRYEWRGIRLVDVEGGTVMRQGAATSTVEVPVDRVGGCDNVNVFASGRSAITSVWRPNFCRGIKRTTWFA